MSIVAVLLGDDGFLRSCRKTRFPGRLSRQVHSPKRWVNLTKKESAYNGFQISMLNSYIRSGPLKRQNTPLPPACATSGDSRPTVASWTRIPRFSGHPLCRLERKKPQPRLTAGPSRTPVRGALVAPVPDRDVEDLVDVADGDAEEAGGADAGLEGVVCVLVHAGETAVFGHDVAVGVVVDLVADEGAGKGGGNC